MTSDREILEMVKGSIEAGGSGVSIGRNVFQHRIPPTGWALSVWLVDESSTVEEARLGSPRKWNG